MALYRPPALTGFLEYAGIIERGPDHAIGVYPFRILTLRHGPGKFRSLSIHAFHLVFRDNVDGPYLYNRYVVEKLMRKRVRRRDSLFTGEMEFVEAVVHWDAYDSDNSETENSTVGVERRRNFRVVIEVGDDYGYPPLRWDVDPYLPSGHLIRSNTIRMFNPSHDGSAQTIASINFYPHHRYMPTSSSNIPDTSTTQTSSGTTFCPIRLGFWELVVLAKSLVEHRCQDPDHQKLTTENTVKFADMMMQATSLHTGAELHEHREKNHTFRKRKEAPIGVKENYGDIEAGQLKCSGTDDADTSRKPLESDDVRSLLAQFRKNCVKFKEKVADNKKMIEGNRTRASDN